MADDRKYRLPLHLESLSKSDLESMCVDCGLCYHASIPIQKGMNLMLPDLRCKHLDVEKGTGKSCCNVYEQRDKVAGDWCMPLAKAVQDGAFPAQCPYVQDMQGYVGTHIPDLDVYEQHIRPDVRKMLNIQGKPSWVSEAAWDQFQKA